GSREAPEAPHLRASRREDARSSPHEQAHCREPSYFASESWDASEQPARLLGPASRLEPPDDEGRAPPRSAQGMAPPQLEASRDAQPDGAVRPSQEQEASFAPSRHEEKLSPQEHARDGEGQARRPLGPSDDLPSDGQEVPARRVRLSQQEPFGPPDE